MNSIENQVAATSIFELLCRSLTVTPTYRKPFDMIFERAEMEEWSGLMDDFRTIAPLGLSGMSFGMLAKSDSRALHGTRPTNNVDDPPITNGVQ